ncbi:MAG: aminopeptidase P family protein [Pseudomonadota bacterium]
MFQSFKSTSNREAGPDRLRALRAAMKAEGVTVFLIPHADEHQNEYLPKRAERLAWLTGFNGSAGFAIATNKTCFVFVDGRYTLQVKEQVSLEHFSPESLIDLPPSKWLAENTDEGDVIGYDPWLMTLRQMKDFSKACEATGAKLKPIGNLIDVVWEDQPAAPINPISIHPVELAGQEAAEKIVQLQQAIREKDCDLAVLTDPASLAWTFNIRGSDVVHNPLPLGFAIIHTNDKPQLFLNDLKIDEDTRDYLEKLARLCDPTSLLDELNKLADGKSVLVDPNQVPVILSEAIENSNGKCVNGRDPVVLPRAIKNPVELEGARNAHIRDGVAVCKFLHWLDQQAPETVTEVSAAKKLEEFRSINASAMGTKLLEISFDTISGHGPNGAIVHYRVTEDTDRKFENNTLYLNDSGGQYEDGTTDITRTIAIGSPPGEAIVDFTLVLKGHIAIATARFPEGTRGVDIDILARNTLWQHGKDYAHGTGHGVGSYLNVHEGPQSISKRGMEPLKPGMIISNEPGYYSEGNYGIRIENLVIVNETEQLDCGNIETHSFETITLAPIDHRLIDISLLIEAERIWLNEYHQRVRETLIDYLEPAEQKWLEDMTSEL